MTTQERADFWQQQIMPGLTRPLPATPLQKPGTGLSPVCLLAQKVRTACRLGLSSRLCQSRHASACSCRERSRLDAHLT